MLQRENEAETLTIRSEAIVRLLDEYPVQIDFDGRLWKVTLLHWNPKSEVIVAEETPVVFHIRRNPSASSPDEYLVTSFALTGLDSRLDLPRSRLIRVLVDAARSTHLRMLGLAASLSVCGVLIKNHYGGLVIGPWFSHLFAWISHFSWPHF